MNKLMETLQVKLMPLANKLADNKFLSALGYSFQILLPIILIGSFACLGAFINIAPWQSFIASTGLNMILMNTQSLTLSLIAFYLVLVLPYQYGLKLKINPISAVVLSVMGFLILTPTVLYTSIPTQWLGYPGLLGAMLVSGLVPLLIKTCIDKKIYIRMPAGVPSIVEDSFASLVPAFFVLVLATLISWLLAKTSFGNFHAVIYQLIQTPLQGFGLSLPAYLTIQVLATLLMFSGIHGNTIFSTITPLTMAASAQNLAALAANQPLPNIITSSFSVFCQPGGIGGTLGLAFMMAFFAKSNRMKTLGKLSLIPAIFGINEPLIFGIPILLNPLLFIPYILSPIVCTVLSYLTIAIGIVPRLTGVEVNWTMPQVISGFLAQGWQASVLQVVLILITTAIWFPFFKLVDKQTVQEESVA
ncbi:MAG: PTS sugar transporter subunit IIC [Erysipelotrichaceae bacterium]|nr:PTS sugar transporter subunit IIC [Erysipelotrichaceae bacterium]